MTEPARLYFHFRSPYSWLASVRIGREGIPVDGIAFAGIPASLDASKGMSPRLLYLQEDIGRIAISMGLPVKLPQSFDTDWIRPNAAFWAAKQAGQGTPFMIAAFARRFQDGADLGSADVIGAIASDLGLPADDIVAAMDDEAMQKAATEATASSAEDGVCGVPFFVYQGQKFWGQDRIDYLKAAMGL